MVPRFPCHLAPSPAAALASSGGLPEFCGGPGEFCDGPADFCGGRADFCGGPAEFCGAAFALNSLENSPDTPGEGCASGYVMEREYGENHTHGPLRRE